MSITDRNVDADTGLFMGRMDEHAGLGYEELTHRQVLERADEQARERGLNDVLMIDADFHQVEDPDWRDILSYIDSDVVRHLFISTNGSRAFVPGAAAITGLQEAAGRIRPKLAWQAARDANPATLATIRETSEMMHVNHMVLFPEQLLGFGRSSLPALEVHVARAYARWLQEQVLIHDSPVLAPLYLPFSDADACVEIIEEFADHPKIVSATTVTNRYEPTHDKKYLKVYAALQERSMPLMFHAGLGYNIAPQAMFNHFLSVHAVSFPYLSLVQCTNWLVNGMPERFPGLKIGFIEGGLSWVPFLMQRLDHTVMMRSSEAPLLQRLPSEYMRDFYYSTQPLELTNMRDMQATFEFINANDRLLWSSDWPHWDWCPPAKIWDLPFLSEAEKRGILGGNAARLYGLPDAPPPITNGA